MPGERRSERTRWVPWVVTAALVAAAVLVSCSPENEAAADDPVAEEDGSVSAGG